MPTTALSSAIIGLEGSLAAHFSGLGTTDSYTFTLAIGYIAMVEIGGMDSVAGAVVGAVIVTALPIVVPNILAHFISSNDANTDGPSLSIVVYGALIIIFVVASHDGRIACIALPGFRVYDPRCGLEVRARAGIV